MSNGTVRILRHVQIENYRKRLKKENLLLNIGIPRQISKTFKKT